MNESLKGSMTFAGCLHFVNKHRNHVGYLGTNMLDIWAEILNLHPIRKEKEAKE